MLNFEIRRVTAAVFPLLEGVAEEVFDEPVDPQRLAGYLAEPVNLLAVAILDEQIVGQAAAVLHRHPDKPTELYIDEVGVTPRYRKQGIGQAMLAELVAWGRELGCATAWLATEVDNRAAQALYAHYAGAEPVVMYQWKL